MVMFFWLAAFVLTLSAALCVGWPLLRRAGSVPAEIDYDREIYLARIGEIESDLAAGRLGKAEAQASRAEEGRKLLAAAETTPQTAPDARQPSSWLVWGVMLALPALAVPIYLLSGQPGMPDAAIAARVEPDLSEQSLEQLLAQAEARLAERPNELRGWLVIAPVYMRLGRVTEGVNAWSNALRLDPGNPAIAASLAEAIVTSEQGVVVERAAELFRQALAAEPGNAKARFYLALALEQQGDLAEAADAWRELVADAPADAPWLDTARERLQRIESGPTQEDIASAAALDPGERQEMIEGMVAGLAQRLRESPDDKEGWRRLIRSYHVLGREEDAQSAIATARSHFADDAAFLAELNRLEQNP